MANRVPLELSYILYDPSSAISLALALVTLSPILLMPAYTALALQTRELTLINMWAGQLLSEALNWVLKHTIKEGRPNSGQVHLSGYGFPSSHSQYMGYFGAFILCHLYFRHRFTSCGYPPLDRAVTFVAYLGVVSWVAAVAYSRLNLLYHTSHQVAWGLGIGVSHGIVHYAVTEWLPYTRPLSIFGRARTAILTHPVAVWMQVRDGWAIWHDGGREMEWKRWKTAYDGRRARVGEKCD